MEHLIEKMILIPQSKVNPSYVANGDKQDASWVARGWDAVDDDGGGVGVVGGVDDGGVDDEAMAVVVLVVAAAADGDDAVVVALAAGPLDKIPCFIYWINQ